MVDAAGEVVHVILEQIERGVRLRIPGHRLLQIAESHQFGDTPLGRDIVAEAVEDFQRAAIIFESVISTGEVTLETIAERRLLHARAILLPERHYRAIVFGTVKRTHFQEKLTRTQRSRRRYLHGVGQTAETRNRRLFVFPQLAVVGRNEFV